jgi:hypothetical protein
MSAPIEEMARWDVGMLDQLQQHYRAAGDAVGAARVDAAFAKKELDFIPQTTEISNCGRLFRQRHLDPETNQLSFTYTGDIGEFIKPFTSGATTGKINRELCSGENAPEARARAAEHRAIFADGLSARAARAGSK